MRGLGVIALGVGLAYAVPALAAGSATGTWRMSNGKVTVRLAPCGTALCGRVVGLKKPLDSEGHAKLDRKNPDPTLRGRPVIGLTILSNMRASGPGKWSGTIYNPDDGKTYSSSMQLLGPSSMKVNGCVAGVFCKSLKFTRVQ